MSNEEITLKWTTEVSFSATTTVSALIAEMRANGVELPDNPTTADLFDYLDDRQLDGYLASREGSSGSTSLAGGEVHPSTQRRIVDKFQIGGGDTHA